MNARTDRPWKTDLLEAIAGDLPDGEPTAPDVQELGDGALRIDGATSVHDARERLGLRALPEGEFSTVAGLVLSLFGRIPQAGESADWNGWSFEVAEVKRWRIGTVVARRKAAPSAAEKRRKR